VKLFIHPDTQRSLDVFMRDAPHAVILTGRAGVGLATIATNFAKQSKNILYTVLPEKDEKIDLEKGTITVQSIRRLYDLTKTIEPNGRIIVIDYAERMGTPAQNAFLKLLEEPVEGTRFLLLTHQPGLLLPTILSRSQQLTVRPVSTEGSNELLDALKVFDATKRAQLLFIANGLPAELSRLVADDAYFTARASIVKDARQFVTGTAYDRLLLANKYKSDRTGALTMLSDAAKMLQKTLADGGVESTLRAVTRVELIHKRITEQGNIRLQLSSALNL
jgi:DNA polymerase-3 subunit delta'